jgi:hypothetical protein
MSRSDHEPEPFVPEPGDPLAAEHEAVSAWVEEAYASLPGYQKYLDVDLKSLPTGRRLLEASPAEAARLVRAAVAQAACWDRAAEAAAGRRMIDETDPNPRRNATGDAAWGRRRKAEAAVRTLMRRALPLGRDDLIAMAEWGVTGGERYTSSVFAPYGAIAKALERFAASHELDDALRAAMGRLAECLRAAGDKDLGRAATTIEQAIGSGPAPAAEAVPAAMEAESGPSWRPAAPAPAGIDGVMVALKRLRGMIPDGPDGPTRALEPDGYPLAEGSPLAAEHELLGAVLQEALGRPSYGEIDLRTLPAWEAIRSLPPEGRARAVLAAAERHVWTLRETAPRYDEQRAWRSWSMVPYLLNALAQEGGFALSRDGLFDLLLYQSARAASDFAVIGRNAWIPRMIREVEARSLSDGERYVLSLVRDSHVHGPALGAVREDVRTLGRLIGDGAEFFLAPGEVWADAVNAELTGLAPAVREPWVALLRHALTAKSARPAAKWVKEAGRLVEAIGPEAVRAALSRWLPLVDRGRTRAALPTYFGDSRGAGDTMNEENADALRGLLWIAPTLPGREALLRTLAAVAQSAYRKVPGVGPRAVKVGNAAVFALSELGTVEAVGQLAMLKVRVRFGTAQKEIEKAFAASAEALSLPRDEIEEMGVPAYGLESVGRRAETLGEHRAELTVDGVDAALRWFDAKGKALKSIPAAVKKEHREELADLQQAAKDLAAMLPAQRDRIDGLFRSRRTWALGPWRERYANHPLVGTIARRLIWTVDGTPALWLDGAPTDVAGQALTLPDQAEIALWHPAGRPVEEVLAWRRRLEELGVTQPFKQAHREVYVLTDAERRTETYSNRFAGHILRQHQFNALCAARGWRNRLRLMVDDTYPPATLELPEWGLRAEYWVEGIGDDYGTDTNESGVYLRLATDQVRFYREGAVENRAHAGGGGYTTQAPGPGAGDVNLPLPLEDIPPLILSEALRDVDLFVGVASVGNDPTWQDGGPGGRFAAYWRDYSFGELAETARTRKAVLERLVPRLKIAPRCQFTERFLVVQGSRRTYRIHLGSGNILMEPNDQYLCIVPDAHARATEGSLFLPFEGDGTLSIILSKAILLADDAKIKDPTINRQIDGR